MVGTLTYWIKWFCFEEALKLAFIHLIFFLNFFYFNKKVSFDAWCVVVAFPEHMDSPVARLLPEGVLRKQNVPPILPAYNKYMCAVDRTNQLGINYDLDRKSRRFWLHQIVHHSC